MCKNQSKIPRIRKNTLLEDFPFGFGPPFNDEHELEVCDSSSSSRYSRNAPQSDDQETLSDVSRYATIISKCLRLDRNRKGNPSAFSRRTLHIQAAPNFIDTIS